MVLKGLDYRTNKPITVNINSNHISRITKCLEPLEEELYIAPGLVDIQINGFKGVDLNTLGLNYKAIKKFVQSNYDNGVTTLYPTLITNANDTISTLLHELVNACEIDSLINSTIGGIHLEGPFLSIEDGPRGAHRKEFVQRPNWELFSKWQLIAKRKIKIITLAPEWAGSYDFIKKCVDAGVVVSIGHTSANSEQINNAIKAGARLSTHLGNASHAMLPRHSNYIYDQLASEHLWASIIADGFHLPDTLLKIFLKTKPNKIILISDATCYAGLPSGEYSAHIGGNVVLDKFGKLYIKDKPNVLAGSAQTLLWGVNQLVNKRIISLEEAWNLASVKPLEFLLKSKNIGLIQGGIADLVLFKKEKGDIVIVKTIKCGKVVYSSS